MDALNARRSIKAASFTESVIRDFTRLADLHGAINLGQGFPDFPAPDEVKEAARRAIADDHNQYPVTWGIPAFREAIAEHYRRVYGMSVDPELEVCVTCGSTEAMIATMLGLLDPGDEVVVFEPYYENYGPDAILSGAVPRLVTLRPPEWTFDEAELRAAFNDRTRAIVVNTPNNPTGKVFSREELSLIGELCTRYDAFAITDEIYEHITYDGVPPHPHRHDPRDGGSDRHDQRVVQDVLGDRVARRVGRRRTRVDGRDPPRPRLPDRGGSGAAADGRHHRARTPRAATTRTRSPSTPSVATAMMRILHESGFVAQPPAGAYYVMADISHLGFADDTVAARELGRGYRRRDRPGLVVLLGSGERETPAAVRVLQAARDARSRRRAPPHARLSGLEPAPEAAGGHDAGRIERVLQPSMDASGGDVRVAEAADALDDRRDARGLGDALRGARRAAPRPPGSANHTSPTPSSAVQSSRPATTSAIRDGVTAASTIVGRVDGERVERRGLVVDGDVGGPLRERPPSAPRPRPPSPPATRAPGRARRSPPRAAERRRASDGRAPVRRPPSVSIRRTCGSGRSFSATCTITPSVPSEPVASRCRS